LVKKRKGRGSHPIPNKILVMEARRGTCRKSIDFIVKSSDIFPQRVYSIRLVISPEEE